MSTHHSTLSPSSAKRWINCPGSVALVAKAPPLPKSEYATEGAVAHSLAEELVTGKVDSLELMARIGNTVMQDGFEIEISEDMIDGAIEYHDLIKADHAALTADKRPASIIGQAEVRVQAKSVDPDLWGTADYILYRPGHKLIVYDYKFGKGVIVDPTKNEQAAIYAIAVMDGAAGWAFDEVEIVICQPRGAHIDGTTRRWNAPISWLKSFRDGLQTAIAATKAAQAPLIAGDWCRWCPARPSCPAIYGAIQKQAQVDFAVAPPTDPKSTSALPDVRLMPVAKLAAALDWEDAINSWYEAVKEVVREKLSAGEEVPGFKLVEGRSNRKWIDEDLVVTEFSSVLGPDRLYEKKLLSPAKLEKIIGKGKVDHLTFKPEVGKAIAKNDDPRPVAKSSAADDFTAIPQALSLDDELLGTVTPTKSKAIWPS